MWQMRRGLIPHSASCVISQRLLSKWQIGDKSIVMMSLQYKEKPMPVMEVLIDLDLDVF